MTSGLKSSIDLTPIVGLLLALVVVMIATAPGAQRAAALDLPPSSHPWGDYEPPPPPWFISIDGAGLIWLANGDSEAQSATVDDVLAEVPAERMINVRADADARYGLVAEIISILEARGRRVALINEDLG